MKTHDNILDILREKGAEAARNMLRALIIQPGAIGDCILTLPLAAFVKHKLDLGGIDILGHTEYVGFLPGRSCIDGVRSIDALELNRLFAETGTFELTDRDSLISAFSDYSWIITFLGGHESNFEQNLIYTANCSHSAEVITLYTKAHQGNLEHVSAFYIRQFVELTGLSRQSQEPQTDSCMIKANPADVTAGKELLSEAGLDNRRKLVAIQPGSGGKEKCWYVGNFLTVAAGLASRGFEVVFLLGPAEKERFSKATIDRINSVAPCLTDLSLTDVVGLLSCSEAFVGNDSGITHLAGALGVRTAVVFGPTEPAVYRPLGPRVSVFTAEVADFTDKSSKGLQQEILYALTA